MNLKIKTLILSVLCLVVEVKNLEQELAGMLGNLHGTEADNLGNAEWIKFLGGLY